MLDTPVLLLVFNRPDTTRQVFEAIKKAQPRQLFVAADGPRTEKPGEAERCQEVRNIASAVDWDCEVKTLFRTDNRGCGLGPAEAITWFFEQVEQGIILEDDCLPDASFFVFCNELLKKYKESKDVVLISGFNPLGSSYNTSTDYFFTDCGGIWGWATWRRAWEMYNFHVPEWKEDALKNKVLKSLPSDRNRADMQQHLHQITAGGRSDYWDFQWWFYRVLQGGIGIMPKHNLIQNIGFGENATHTFDLHHPNAKLFKKSIAFPLVHPPKIEVDKNFTFLFCQNQIATKNFFSIGRWKQWIKKFCE